MIFILVLVNTSERIHQANCQVFYKNTLSKSPDGSVFKNFAPRGQKTPLFPVKPLGYYSEFVHPTPGGKGPGAMRIVKGQSGEMWFTPDHYKSFIQVR
jgi:guanyl-specific ribonuclease Sa